MIALDLETHPIQPGQLTPKAVVMSCFDRGPLQEICKTHPTRGLLTFPHALDVFEAWLDDQSVTLTAHNGAYDLAVLAVERPRLLPKIFQALDEFRIRDTMVRGKLIDIARGELKFRTRDDGTRIKTLHSLEAMAKLYLGRDLQKKDTYRVRYHELDGLPLEQWPKEAIDYAADDAEVALQVFEAQEKYIKESALFDGTLPNEAEQTRAAWALHLMSVWGITTDPQAVSALKRKLEKQLEGADEFLQKAGLVHQTGSKKNPKWSKDTKAIKARIEAGFKAQGKRIPLTDTGQVSTSAEAKRDSGDSDLIKMASFSLAETLLNNFIPTLERGTKHPIQARFDVLKESGRISCSDPNLLNPPAGDEGVREAFIARPGYVFIDADYSVIELRALAQICLDKFGFSKLADVFRAGGDPHTALLEHYGLPTGDEAMIEIHGEMIPARRFAKMNNFGFASGLGEDTFIEYAKGYGITLNKAEAHDARMRWFGLYSEMDLYFRWISRLVPHDTATIRQPYSGRIRGGVHFTSAVNTMFQGLTADGAKEGLWLVTKECYLDKKSPLYGSRPVMHLYDENIAEAPEEKASEAADRLCELMKIGMEKYVKDVPVKVSKPKLMRRWSKNAKCTQQDGKWTVWDWDTSSQLTQA